MRSLAGLRAFARYLEKNGKGKVGALAAVRAPKIGKTLPRPLAADAAKSMADPDSAAGDDREPWIHARDAAVLGLLYGCGLRISEALGLKRADFGGRDVLTVMGKGRKERMVPLIPPGTKAGRRLYRAVPVRSAGTRPAVRRRQRRPAVAAPHSARHGAAARRARPAGNGDAARAAPFLRHASAWPAAATCARSRNCSATLRCRRRRSIPRSTPSD